MPMPDCPVLFPDERTDEINEHLRLIQKKDGLTFGTDAFLLAAYVRRQSRVRAVDLGAGTGILPLLLCAKEKAETVTALELQPDFADLIRRNAEENGFSDRIFPVCGDVREITAKQIGGEVDLVVSNPPYMKTTSGRRNESDRKYIARHETHGDITDFCAAAGRLLRFGGRFVCVFRPDRLTELIPALRDAGMEAKRMTFVHPDPKTEPCLVLTEAVRGAAPSVRITPPLFLYAEDSASSPRPLTEEAKKIYDTGLFPD